MQIFCKKLTNYITNEIYRFRLPPAILVSFNKVTKNI